MFLTLMMRLRKNYGIQFRHSSAMQGQRCSSIGAGAIYPVPESDIVVPDFSIQIIGQEVMR